MMVLLKQNSKSKFFCFDKHYDRCFGTQNILFGIFSQLVDIQNGYHMVPVIHMFSKFGKIRKFPNKDHNIIRFCFLHKFLQIFRDKHFPKKKKKKKSNGNLIESQNTESIRFVPNNNNNSSSSKVHFSSKFIRYISWESVEKVD